MSCILGKNTNEGVLEGLELDFLTPFLFCGRKQALCPVSEDFLLKPCFPLPTEES